MSDLLQKSKFLFAPMMATVATPVMAHDCGDLRVTAAVPVAVKHFSERKSEKNWNEGFLKNSGLIVQADSCVAELGETADVRVGITAGVYKNSIYKTSVAAGLNFEIDKSLSQHFALHAGTALGAVSGYGKIRPAVMPYAGVSMDIGKGNALGIRAQWLPAKTAAEMAGYKRVGASDAIVGVVTLSRQF